MNLEINNDLTKLKTVQTIDNLNKENKLEKQKEQELEINTKFKKLLKSGKFYLYKLLKMNEEIKELHLLLIFH